MYTLSDNFLRIEKRFKNYFDCVPKCYLYVYKILRCFFFPRKEKKKPFSRHTVLAALNSNLQFTTWTKIDNKRLYHFCFSYSKYCIQFLYTKSGVF